MSVSSSITAAPAAKLAKTSVVVFALTLGAFAVGTSEFMIGGLLNEVAASLQVSIPTAGLLISGYAAGVTIGGPLLTLLTGGLERKRQIGLLLTIFVLGNLLCALSDSFGFLLAGRLVTALCHGAFYGAASVIAVILVPSERRARAIALISSGVMIANVLGVPAGAALGHLLGWQGAFWAVSIVGGCAGLTLLLALPGQLGSVASDARSQLKALRRRQVIIGLLLSSLFTCGLFTSVPYLTPMLVNWSHVSPLLLPWLLMSFGAGATAGTLAGGRMVDWGLMTSLAVAFGAQVFAYGTLGLFIQNDILVWVVVFMLGACSMLAVAPLRTLVLDGAADAPALAATLTSSAFNLGVAIGAAVGSSLLAMGLGYASLPIVALGFPLLALASLAAYVCLRRRSFRRILATTAGIPS